MSDNPFSKPPQEGGNKHGFGKWRIITNYIELKKGASYTIPGLTNMNGEPFEFRGKQKVASSNLVHVIIVSTQTKQDGSSYDKFVDFLYRTNDELYAVAYPALKAVLGDKLAPNATAYIEYEEVSVPVKGRDKPGLTFRALRQFKNATEMDAAREAYFSRFASNGTQAEDSDSAEYKAGIPEGYTAQSWAAMKPELERKYAEHVQTLNGPVNKRRTAALAYIAENEAGSTPEQLAELIGV